MIEFGSDSHKCDTQYWGERTIHTFFHATRYYTSGRMALIVIAQQEEWKRLWVPSYFCHEIINAWKTHIDICLYDDYPLEENDAQIVRALPYQAGDALLRMNYFGLREKRTNDYIPVPVIEDHSHALISEWALHSDADWCIASLRKSLPLAFGGILWSPKGNKLPSAPKRDSEIEQLAIERYQAMDMKAQYLRNGYGNKDAFRAKYIATEEGLDHLTDIFAIDSESEQILKRLNILKWNDQKLENWKLACKLLDRFKIIGRNTASSPFSIIIAMKNKEERDNFKSFLIQHAIYPAILWNIPDNVPHERCKDFGERMLSIHCDARYTELDIQQMCKIINQYDTNH